MLDHVEQVVIDEADRMADMGFLPAVRRILAGVRAPRQVQLFSATLNGAVGKLVAEVQSSPARHEVGPLGPDIALAKHVFWNVVRAERTTIAAAAIRSMGSTIVFCRTRHGADRLTRNSWCAAARPPRPSTAAGPNPSGTAPCARSAR